MGRTKERAWRNTKEAIKKPKHVQKLLNDSDDDVVILDPKQPESDTFLQSDIVYVRSYKVKRSIATILEAIFKKHGDIAANCVFKSSSTRIYFLEVVCEVVRRILTSDIVEMVEDIERQLSDAEAANINVSWIRAHFEDYHKRKEAQMLMEAKANIALIKKPALKDLVMRYENLMSAYEGFEEADRCMQVLHLVEKKLRSNILESKGEKEAWVEQSVL